MVQHLSLAPLLMGLQLGIFLFGVPCPFFAEFLGEPCLVDVQMRLD